MTLRARLNQFCQYLTHGRHTRRPAARTHARPGLTLETLEDRSMPSIVFSPHFPGESAQLGSSVYASAHQVELIFWGSFWANPSNSPSLSAIQGEVQAILSSTYLQGTSRLYGTASSDPLGQTVNPSTSIVADPTSGFSVSNLLNVVHQMDSHNLLPDPDSVSPTPIYVVITPPGVTSDQGAFVGGYHINQNTDNTNFLGIPIDPDPAPMIWAGVNTFNGHTLQDGFSLVFSHELAETMSNPNLSGGITVTAAPGFASAFPGSTGTEIGDNEGGGFSYGYRLGGALVQAYFESSTGNFVVEDGTTSQNFTLTPNYSGNFFQGTYALTITGDQLASANDTITLATSPAGGVTATLNGYAATFDPGVISGITVKPGSGSNKIDIESLPNVAVTINDVSTSSDAIRISPTAQFLDNVQGSITINGSGADTLTVCDQNDFFSADVYTITSSTVGRNDFPGVTYVGVSAVTVNGGSGAEGYNIYSTGAPVTINAGNSNDAFNVCPAFLGQPTSNQFLDAIQGALTVNGQGGSDTLNLFDQNDAFNDTVGITWSQVTRTAMAPITYGTLESVVYNGGSGALTYNIASTAAGTPVTVNAGSGNDIVNVCPASQLLDNIQGAVKVNGQAGTDTLNLFDQSDTFNDTIGITATQVTRSFMAPVTYLTLESMVYNGGSGALTYNVTSTSAGTPVTVNAGSGNDMVNVGSASSSLDGIQGALTLNGQGGSDTLNFNDQAASAGHAYTFTATTLTRTGAAVMTFGTFETINLTGTSSDDSLVLQSLPAGVTMDMELGTGTNRVYGPNTPNTWVINGSSNGGGRAVLNSLYTLGSMTIVAGGSAPDRFVFMPGGYMAVINGGGGGDTLDYSNWNTGVTVNLGAYGSGTYGSATGVGSSVNNIQNVIGSPYADTLTAGIYGSVLDGMGGNDTIAAYAGGTARYVLIGGNGSDKLVGGPNGDLLIGGYTSWDNNAASLAAAMNAIFAEWASMDTFAQRQSFLSGPTGRLNGSTFLNNSTVIADAFADSITPGGGSSWNIPS